MALLITLAACDLGGTAAGPAGSASSAAWDDLSGPLIRIQNNQVLVDGTLAGSTRAIEDLGRLQKVDEEFDLLKRKRELWKSFHPDEPFPGKALLQADPLLPLLVVKSVFQTAAYAGYPNITFELNGKRLEVRAQIPGPPGWGPPKPVRMYDWRGEPAQAPGQGHGAALHVHVSDTQVKLVWKQGETVIAERAVAFQEGEARGRSLVKPFEKDWHEWGSHHFAADEGSDQAIVHADNRLPLKDLLVVIEALLTPKRTIRAKDGSQQERPVFEVTFSVR